MLSLLLFAIVVPLFIVYYVRRKRRYEEFWRHVLAIPGPKARPILGTLNKIHTPESLFQTERENSNNYAPIYRLWTLDMSIVCLVNPEDIEMVLNNPKHSTKSFVYKFIHEWLGTGLLTADGEKWFKRRKIITPAFHFSILQEFVELFNNETESLVNSLNKLCHQAYIDVVQPLTEFALNSIAETSLGVRLRDNPQSMDYKQAVIDYGESFALRITRPWLFIPFLYRFSFLWKRNKKIINTLHTFSSTVVKKREEDFVPSDSQQKRMAFLDILLQQKHNGADIDAAGISEELDTFMFAGHDTTSVSLFHTLMALAEESAIQEELYEEIVSVLGESQAPTFQDLKDMPFLDRCVKESLRLYPSVTLIGRVAGEEIHTKTGYVIPKGCYIHIMIHDLHRRPEIYEDPDKFNPDRFLPENCKDRHPYAYIPFSAGSRNCIGQKFAILELKAALCGVLRRFKLEPVTTQKTLVHKQDFVLRPASGIKIKFIPRK